MDRRRLFEFLLLKPAFSSRNLSSIALVVLFFLIYVFSGGKVSWVPAVKQVRTGSFGAASVPSRSSPQSEFSGDIVDEEAEARAPLRGASGRNPAQSRQEPVDVPREEPRQAAQEPAAQDGDSKLSAIRERLKNLGSK